MCTNKVVPLLGLSILIGISSILCDRKWALKNPITVNNLTNQLLLSERGPYVQGPPSTTTPWPKLGANPHPPPKSNPQLNVTPNVATKPNVQTVIPRPSAPSSPKLPDPKPSVATATKPPIPPKPSIIPSRNVATTFKPFSWAPLPSSPTKPLQPVSFPSRNPVPNTQNISPKPIVTTTKPSAGSSVQNSNKNESTSDGLVQDYELREFSELLLTKDFNNAAKYIKINYQGQTTSRSPDDVAPLPLITIGPEVYQIPTIEKMLLLHNNYFLESSVNEHYTGNERIEENNLLDALVATTVMQQTRNFLVQKGRIGKDPKEFKDALREIWFNMYSRGEGRIGSSGFEHVFVAEIKKNEVSGLHNWLYFGLGEKNNETNYLGYMKKVEFANKGAILKHHFNFHGIDKPVGSMFIGTSPELEMALYSTCFLLRPDRICPLKLDGNKFIIRTFTFRYRGKNLIGSAFPEI